MNPHTVPVVSIVGKGDSGKTTFLEKLIRVLAGRGVKVATVKHHVHDYDIDVPGKDSWRHARAGAAVTMVSSPDKFSLVSKVERELTLAELAGVAADSGADILLTEGFKREATTRIEVARRVRSESLLSEPDELIALVTDMPELAPPGIPTFGLDDAEAVAELVSDRFLRGSEGSPGGSARSYAAENPPTDSPRVCLSTAPPGDPTPTDRGER
jgi:molybdopterin-guanine dinucleotide biosynthesis protein B